MAPPKAPSPASRPRGAGRLFKRKGAAGWSVRVRLPKRLGGREITRSLGTADRREAEARSIIVAAQERSRAEAEAAAPIGRLQPVDPLAVRADWWLAQRVPHPLKPGRFDVPDHLEEAWIDELDALAGDPVGEDSHGEPVYDPARLAAAQSLAGLVTGARVPVGAELDRYIAQEGLKASYSGRTRLAVRELGEWLKGQPGGDNLGSVTRRTADAFGDHGANLGRTAATVNSHLSALSAYWAWLRKRGFIEQNPWRDQARRAVDRSGNADKRPFTDPEIKAFLSGPASATLHDMMRVAALSGLRLTEIGALTVADTANGVLNVRDSKSEAGIRRVPLHPALARLVALRCEGKAASDFLIEELTAPPSRGGRRGGKIGERFTAYRRELGLDARQPGRRQADADFHSFRRWFATKLEQAETPPHWLPLIMGHEQGRQGVTFKHYAAGATTEQLAAFVAKVRLPE